MVVAAIFNWQRLKARKAGVTKPLVGAISFAQRFASNLSMHPHYHVLVPEGVFFGDDNEFAPLPPPDDEEVDKILRRVVKRFSKLAMAAYPDGLPYAEDAKAALSDASVQTRLPFAEAQPPKRRRR